jgi:homoserine O-acetyltransferase
MVGMLTYRTPLEVERRFRPRVPGTHPVRGYLDHHGEKLVRRFTSRAYRALLDAIDAHDVGRERGGVGAALRPFRGRLVGVGIPGDLLYPPAEVLRWTRAAGAEYRELVSRNGHDGFLLETGAVGALLAEALAPGSADRPTASAPLPAANLGAGPPP